MERLIASCSLTIVFLLFVAFIAGCGLSSDDSDNDFEMEATIAGQEWKGSSTARLSAEDALVVNGQQGNDDCNYESISIVIAEFEGTGDYKIYNNSYAEIIGCDGVASFGHSFDTTGTAAIRSYDEFSAIVEG